MDKKALIASVVTAVLVLIATSLVKDYMATNKHGEDAQIAAIVKEVIREELTMANGKTYGEKLTEISDNQIVIKTELKTVKESIGALTED